MAITSQKALPVTASRWLAHTKREGLHVGLIPDGMRRWGKQHNIDLPETYRLAVHVLTRTIDFFFDNDAGIVSIYFLSADNLRRTPYEVRSVLDAIYFFSSKVLPELVKKWKFRIVVAGDVNILEDELLVSTLNKLQDLTASFTTRKLYACINYDPIMELQTAVMKTDGKGITEILDHLYVKEPVDLCLRTGNETRISTFLPLQLSYAELYFIRKYFVDVTMADLEDVWSDFKIKNRRTGK